MKKIELMTEDELVGKLRDCLERGELPDYFLYLGDRGVQNWLALSESDEFPIASGLTEHLKRNLPRIIRHLPASLDLASIGVGNGEKESAILGALPGYCRGRYFPVDVSSPMVDEALETASGLDIETTGMVALLEDLPLLRSWWRSPVLLCLLGNNFCNYEPDYLLGMVRDHLGPDDLFLFDCHLLPLHGNAYANGRKRTEHFYRSTLNVHFNIDPLVQRGLDPGSCAFHLDLVPAETSLGTTQRTSKWIGVLEDARISCGQERVALRAGDRIDLGFTYKYTFPLVDDYLACYGFRSLERLVSSDGENLLALVRAGRPGGVGR